MKNSLIHCSTSTPHMAWGTCLIAAQFLQQLLHHSAWLHLPQLPNPPSSYHSWLENTRDGNFN